MGADSRTPAYRPEGCLRRFSRQAEGRGRLFDGGYRPVGVFAVLHAVGVVSVLSALARGGLKTSNCHTLFGMAKIPTDNHIRSMLDPVHPSHLQSSFDQTIAELLGKGGMKSLQRLDGRALIALDGTE